MFLHFLCPFCFSVACHTVADVRMPTLATSEQLSFSKRRKECSIGQLTGLLVPSGDSVIIGNKRSWWLAPHLLTSQPNTLHHIHTHSTLQTNPQGPEYLASIGLQLLSMCLHLYPGCTTWHGICMFDSYFIRISNIISIPFNTTTTLSNGRYLRSLAYLNDLHVQVDISALLYRSTPPSSCDPQLSCWL